MARMSSIDAAWYRMETSRSGADIACLLQFDGVVEEARLRELLSTRLLRHARFRQRVAAAGSGLTLPSWQEEPPSLDWHFSRQALLGAHELPGALDLLINEPLDFAHSPWRARLFDLGADASALFVQLHHCMGDGFALLDILLSLAEGATAAQTSARREPAPRTRRAQLLELLRRTPRTLADLTYLLRLPFDPPSRLQSPLAGTRRIAWSDRVELARVSALAHARHATINDVLMAAISCGLQRYLSERETPPGLLRAIVPVNLRPTVPQRGSVTGNWFGLVYVRLPLDAADAERSLDRIHRAVGGIKHSEQALAALAVLAVLGRLPNPLDRIAQRILARKASLVVSNVPGPRTPIQLAGCQVRDVIFWVPHPSGLTCGISIFSYAGWIRIGVRTDVAAIADPDKLARYVERELADWCETSHVEQPTVSV
ncbi:MAG TPA: WS/DGAT domain-containing protein [Polyangiales bacterium]|nr:WS/DGAT domain-containing protein [Polyangiales bacterium]